MNYAECAFIAANLIPVLFGIFVTHPLNYTNCTGLEKTILAIETVMMIIKAVARLFCLTPFPRLIQLSTSWKAYESSCARCRSASASPAVRAASVRGFKPHFVCFPEYFFVNKRSATTDRRRTTSRASSRVCASCLGPSNATVIGGTMPELDGERLHNTSFVYSRGERLGFYRKRNLFFAEEGKITPGDRFSVFTAGDIRFGVLICADVFKDESFSR